MNPMKKTFYYLVALLFCVVECNAQINESDTAKFQTRISLTGNYQTGNVEVLTIKSKLDIIYAPVNCFVIKSQNNSLYQAFYSNKADNDIFSRNYLYYKPQNKIYPFAIGYISTNFRREINFRYFAGSGVTWQAVNRENHVLKFSASAVYEQTKFTHSLYNYSAYNGNDKIRLWRATAYLGGWNYFFNKHLRLYYDAYWQPAFNNTHNYRTQLDIGADFPVWKGLSFSILYTYTHENVVVQKIKPDDRILTFGLSCFLRKTRSPMLK